MENATKALIMAAGVLIAIALLSLMVYAFRIMALNSANIYSEYDKADINQFNQKFLNFEGKTDLLAQDVVTAINYAIDNEKTGGMPVHVTVKVTEGGVERVIDYNTFNVEDFMINRVKKRYRCQRTVNSDYTEVGLLREIRFAEN